MVKILLDNKYTDITQMLANGNQYLDQAISLGRPFIINELLDHGLKVRPYTLEEWYKISEEIKREYSEGEGPREYSEEDIKKTTDLLTQNIRKTEFLNACSEGKLDKVKELLTADADVVNATNENQRYRTTSRYC